MENNPNAYKLLICGDVNGNFSLLNNKLSVLHNKKGPFKFCLCVGKFFSDDHEINLQLKDYESGDCEMPIPIYVFDEKPQDFDLKSSESVKYVNSNFGEVYTSEGFRIIFLINTIKKDVDKLIEIVSGDKIDANGIDFLVTDWPFGVISNNDYMDESPKPIGNELTSKLAMKVTPRYHFAAKENVHYHRTAYKNIKTGSSGYKMNILTRFVALRAITDKKTTKSFHALCVLPINKMTTKEIMESQKCSTYTANPYVDIQFNNANNSLDAIISNEDLNSIGANINANSTTTTITTTITTTGVTSALKSKTLHDEPVASTSNHDLHDSNKKFKVDQTDCWFCIGNEKVEKHYIIHMKEHMYLTRAKGGLTYEHMIISSLQHYKSLLDLPSFAIPELESYKSALVQYYKSKNCEVVFYERNFKSTHIQIHAVPIPSSAMYSLNNVFIRLCSENHLKPIKTNSLITSRTNYHFNVLYFYIEFPNNVNYICQNLHNNFRLYFGRMLLGHPKILNMPDRTNWRNCVYDLDLENKYTQLLKGQLKNYIK